MQPDSYGKRQSTGLLHFIFRISGGKNADTRKDNPSARPAGDSFNQCFARSSPREQQSTGLLHLIFRISGGKNADTHSGIGIFGDPPEIRTPDPLLKRQLLCQLS